ncbi:MAG: diacylglycerol kinase [Holosporales bacterium]|jgi:diacylglycerol kinase (ATP)|nr:diacylglycerol kinase [Holosporales bacterium]
MQIVSVKGIWRAAKYSVSGILYLCGERAFRQELALGIILIAIEFFRDTPGNLRLYLFSSYCIILITEAINTAIETVINRISTDYHELSKKAKDIGSAAVIIAIAHFIFVFGYSFMKYL